MTKHPLTLFLTAALLIFSGCGSGSRSVAETEAKEREDALYRKALDHERAAKWADAAADYKRLLSEKPESSSAHFQLALILHDHEQDYIAAIYHYRRYLEIRGSTSEKKEIVAERITNATQLLTAQLLRSDAFAAGEKNKLLQEAASLVKQLDQAKTKVTAAEKSQAAAEQKVTNLSNEITRLRRLTEQIKGASASELSVPDVKPPNGDDARAKTIAAALRENGDATAQATATAPADKQRTASIRDALKLIEESDAPPPPPDPPAVEAPLLDGTTAKKPDEERAKVNAAADSARSLNPLKKQEVAPATSKPQTYVVQPGDTLFRISERFYGDVMHWKKIRDANRTTIDPDGRLRTGQTIKIP